VPFIDPKCAVLGGEPAAPPNRHVTRGNARFKLGRAAVSISYLSLFTPPNGVPCHRFSPCQRSIHNCARPFGTKQGKAIHESRWCSARTREVYTKDFEVKKIIGVRGGPGNRFYRVWWEGYLNGMPHGNRNGTSKMLQIQ
jgi:hypothetical protein